MSKTSKFRSKWQARWSWELFTKLRQIPIIENLAAATSHSHGNSARSRPSGGSDGLQLFGKQTRDLDRRTGLQTAAQRRRTLEFRDVLQPHADPCPNLRIWGPKHSRFEVHFYNFLQTRMAWASRGLQLHNASLSLCSKPTWHWCTTLIRVAPSLYICTLRKAMLDTSIVFHFSRSNARN